MKLFVREKAFYKLLLTIAVPIALQNLITVSVSMMDTLMIGQLGETQLSATSIANQLWFMLMIVCFGVAGGANVLIAQYWGKGDKVAVERIFAYVMKVTAAVSFLFFLAGMCVPGSLMRVFTNELPLIEGGRVYLRTVSLAFLLTGISQVYLCILKNTGKAAKSSVISSVSVVVNIILNAILIFGWFGLPQMGIAGAALATVIARVIEVAWCIFETVKKDSAKLRVCHIMHNDKRLRHDFWKYSSPVLGNEIVWGVGFTMYSVIMGHLGSDAVAANSIANIVKNLVACFCLGLGSGGGIMVGNELGAGRLDKAKEYGGRLCRLSVLCGVASGIVLLALSPLILAVTDLSVTANAYLKWMLVMCSYYMVGKSVNGTTIAGIFCAGGDSKFGFLCDTVTMWCITVPLGFLTAFMLKLPVLAVYFIVNLDEIVKLPAVYRHYKKYKWVKDLTVCNGAE